MKKLIMIATLLFSAGQLFAQTALGEVVGEVVDSDGEGIYDAHVYIDDAFGKRYQVKTGPDGRFRISAIPSGTYLMNIRQLKDTLKNIQVEVPMEGFFNAGVITFYGGVAELPETYASAGLKDLKLVDGNLPVNTLSSEDIEASPVKFDVKKLVTSMSSDVRQTEDGELVFRGARKGDMIYLIDGVKTRDAGSVPSVSIGKMMLYTGGLPAKYGDTLGGVVVMESKSYFDLYNAWYAQKLKAGK